MRSILITGASSGIGRALAEALAAPGRTLHLLGRRLEGMDPVASEVIRRGGVPALYAADVRDRERMERVAREILSGGIVPDLVVANAGIRGGPHGNDAESADLLFRTNVLGVLHTIGPFVSDFKKARKGRIAVIGSLAGYRGLPEAGGYCASKAAIGTWTDSLRYEMEPYGVRVSLVRPGFVRTEMTRNNPYPMPFILSPSRAAEIIIRELERDRALIEFPLPLVLLVRTLASLPPRISDRLLRLFSSRTPPPEV